MNNFRKTLRKKSTEELVNILQEVEKDYGDDSLNAAREQTIKMIENILEERGVDVSTLGEEAEETEETEEVSIENEEVESENIDYEAETATTREKELETSSEKKRISVREDISDSDSGKRYRALKFLSGFIKISSFIFLILVLVGNFLSQDGLFTSLVIIIISLVILIPYFALSELIYLFIDIEENTRKTRELLNRFYKGG
ncbi:MAG: hypothetical protein ACOCQS_00440 [Bacillota bacterium]